MSQGWYVLVIAHTTWSIHVWLLLLLLVGSSERSHILRWYVSWIVHLIRKLALRHLITELIHVLHLRLLLLIRRYI